MDNLRIGIIGNIGVGKSTLIKSIQSPPQSDVLLNCLPNREGDEQVYTFPEHFNSDVLDAFYKDPIKYAFIAQVEFFNGRLERQAEIEQARGIVLEDRTIFEDYHIFGKAQKINGFMTNTEFAVYQREYELMTKKINEPDLMVYLRADTDTLLKRIKKRGRDSEKGIGRDYLDLLNGLYETFIIQHINCPVLVIDATEEKPLNDYLMETTKKIVYKIQELDLRVTTPGLKEWVTLSETDAAIRAIDAERQLEDYLKNKKRLITLAGNVGLGKSTVTALMHRSLRVNALYEKPEKNPLLGKFLKDKKKYCYDLQRHFLDIRAEQRRIGKSGDTSYVKDRTLAEDIMIFCQQFYQSGILSASQLDLLTTEFRAVNQQLPQADLMIVLQGKTELAWHRIQQRARAIEMNGGWEYAEIRSLNNLYKTYAEDVRKCGYHKNPVLEINVDKLDLTNRMHMGYLFEKTYQALQQN